MSQSQLDDLWPEAVDALKLAKQAFRTGENRIAACRAVEGALAAYAAIMGPSPAMEAALDAVDRMTPPAHMTDPELVRAIWGEGMS